MVPLAERPDCNGTQRHLLVPYSYLSRPFAERSHPVLQPLADSHTHTLSLSNSHSVALSHPKPNANTDPHTDPHPDPNAYAFPHPDC